MLEELFHLRTAQQLQYMSSEDSESDEHDLHTKLLGLESKELESLKWKLDQLSKRDARKDRRLRGNKRSRSDLVSNRRKPANALEWAVLDN
jgi:hypothetical protein